MVRNQVHCVERGLLLLRAHECSLSQWWKSSQSNTESNKGRLIFSAVSSNAAKPWRDALSGSVCLSVRIRSVSRSELTSRLVLISLTVLVQCSGHTLHCLQLFTYQAYHSFIQWMLEVMGLSHFRLKQAHSLKKMNFCPDLLTQIWHWHLTDNTHKLLVLDLTFSPWLYFMSRHGVCEYSRAIILFYPLSFFTAVWLHCGKWWIKSSTVTLCKIKFSWR